MANRFANPVSRAQVRMSKTVTVTVDSPTQTAQDIAFMLVGMTIGAALGPVAGAREALKQSQKKDYVSTWSTKLRNAIASEEKETKK